jgi:hypothetical protein
MMPIEPFKESEEVQFQEIITEHEQEEKVTDSYIAEVTDLKAKLEHFNREVIRVQHPATRTINGYSGLL